MSDNFMDLARAMSEGNDAAAKAQMELIANKVIAENTKNLIIPTLDEAISGARGGVQGFSFVNTIVEGLSKGLPDALKKWWKDWTIESENEYQAKLDPIFTDMKNKGIITQDMVDEITSLAKDKPFWGSIMRWLSILVIYISYFRHKMEAITSEANQQVNKQFRPNLPGPGEMLRAAFIAPEKTGYVRERLSRLGYKEEDINLMFIAQYGTYTVDEAFRLWLRGKLSDTDLVKRLREHGLTDTKINELKELYNVIPPIGDIFTLLAKEAFEPDQIAKFGLADEYPSQMEPYAAAHGLSPEWARRFWSAH
jgi:hypothetical protein